MTKRKIVSIILFLILGFLAAYGYLPSAASDPLENNKFYQVSRVIDGDTLEIIVLGTPVVIRLLGVNTPETVDPQKKDECFGAEASKKLKDLVLNKSVRLVSDPSQSDRDKYGRLLRYAFLADGTLANLELIKQGYAQEATYSGAYIYQLEFRAAQLVAQTQNLGLWNNDVCP